MYSGIRLSIACLLIFSFIFSSCKEENQAPSVQPPSKIVSKPVVYTDSTRFITDSSAQINGRIESTGSDTIKIAGMEWKAGSESDTSYRRLFAHPDSLKFSFQLSGLNPGTSYRIRAFASSAAGISYGNVRSFETDSIPAFTCPATVSDIEGNVYQVVKIGTQCWMKENLRSTKLRNGNNLKSNLNAASWSSQPVAAYSSYADNTANASVYGYLYNHYTILEAGKICPAGWHVPTDADWTELENYLGGTQVAGGKLKAVSGLWAGANSGASNSSGFTGLPSGKRTQSGLYQDLGGKGYWWSSGQINNVRPRSLGSVSPASSIVSPVNRSEGFSIRCIAD